MDWLDIASTAVLVGIIGFQQWMLVRSNQLIDAQTEVLCKLHRMMAAAPMVIPDMHDCPPELRAHMRAALVKMLDDLRRLEH